MKPFSLLLIAAGVALVVVGMRHLDHNYLVAGIGVFVALSGVMQPDY